MFAKKEIDVFDKEIFEKGKVVTYCSVSKLGGDMFQEGISLAGIVTEVTESHIRLMTWSGDKHTIFVHQLLGSPALDKTNGRLFKIFSVFSPKELKELGKEQ